MNAIVKHSDDELLEYMIEHCLRQMNESDDEPQQMHWWLRMAHYIAQRSAAQVRMMELAKGLQ